ncbi:MAG: TonB-dependent receptor [Bryobacterales bacterium]|nr:TonB-dependent receptor [Bryobacterales bacterium]
MIHQRHLCGFLLLVLILCVPGSIWAQSANGNIVGRVVDASGAPIPGVDVVATDVARGVTIRVTTDATGIYRLLYLAPSRYNITYTANGFAPLQRSALELRSNDTLTVDIELQIGNVVERIEVTGQTPLLEAATSSTGTTISGRSVDRLPVQQRYMWMTMYFMPGVTSMAGFHIAGQRDRGIGYTMDGISATEPVRGGVATNRIMSTTPNAVEEVKLTTTVMPAEYGHSPAGGMSLTFKSGTNQLHGEAEDRYINNALLHRNHFVLNRPDRPFVYHNLAGILSGPVVLPKLYDGRNKTFFLFGYSRHHEKNDRQVFSTVPTQEMLGGDFSFGGIGFPLYDPASTRRNDAGQWVRDPIAGNVIPQSRISPVARNFLNNQPWNAPNNAGGAGFIDRSGPRNNLGADYNYRSFRTRYDVKIDQVFNEQNRMFGRFSHVRNRARGRDVALNWELIDGNFVLVPSDQVNGVISDTHVFGPTLINEIRVGANRRMESRTPGGINANWGQQLGIPGISGETFPSFFNSAGAAFFSATMPGGFSYSATENFTLQDNLTKIVGRHQLKMGYEMLRTRANTRAASLPGGVYRFGGTDFPFTPNTGNDFAAFLMGSVVRADFNLTLANWLPRWWSHAWYFQDDWTVNSKLTLNLGVRWSHESPFNTKYGQHSQFDSRAVDPVTGRVGAITHPGSMLAKRDLNNFQPRVGMAYRINDRMVFRGGFGVTTIDLFTAALDQNFEEYFTGVTLQPVPGDPRPAFLIDQGPGPVQYNVLPDGTSPFVGVNYSGRNATWYDPNLRAPYVMSFNASWQYQFADQWLVDLSYQGSGGVGLLEGWNQNMVRLDVSTDRAELDRIFSNYQQYRPFNHFGNINLWSNSGHNTFHSGTIKVEKRLSQGFTMNSFYTWGRAINSGDNDAILSGVTPYDRSLEKARAGYDVQHRWVSYATYEMPFGRGKKWMNSNRALDWFLGGWNIAGIQTFQSGIPVSFTVAGSPNRYLQGVVRANQLVPNDQVRVADWTEGNRFNANPIWNINAFAYPDAYTPGTLGRNTLEGPGLIWTQGSLAKVLNFGERTHLDVRFDVNNIFKRPNFANPNAAVNLTNPLQFGRPTGTIGGFCCLGGQFVGTLGLRLWF